MYDEADDEAAALEGLASKARRSRFDSRLPEDKRSGFTIEILLGNGEGGGEPEAGESAAHEAGESPSEEACEDCGGGGCPACGGTGMAPA